MKSMELNACLAGYQGETGHANIELVEYDGRERIVRALKALGMFWGLAAVSVFIAVAHFFLVPGFFITGIVLFFRRLKPGSIIAKARGTCPNCLTEQKLDIAGRFKNPAEVMCCTCKRTLTLTAPPGEAE